MIPLLALYCAAGGASAGSLVVTDQGRITAPGGTVKILSAAGGQVVGESYPYAVVWKAGSATTLYRYDASAYGTDGVHQVGYAEHNRAMLWSGTPESGVNLHPAGFTASVAKGVKGSQQVGSGFGTPTGGRDHALLWNGTASSVVDLHPSGWSSSQANATDGRRQAGSGYPTTVSGDHALLWDGTADSVVDLNPAAFKNSRAWGIGGQQQVGNGSPLGSNDSHALLWEGTAESAVDLHPSGWNWSMGIGTNGLQQVGYGKQTINSSYHAMLWSGTAGSFIDLQSLLPAGFRSSQAFSIDDAGNIYGIASAADGTHAVMWSVPEPASLALLMLGGACLLRRSQTPFR